MNQLPETSAKWIDAGHASVRLVDERYQVTLGVTSELAKMQSEISRNTHAVPAEQKTKRALAEIGRTKLALWLGCAGAFATLAAAVGGRLAGVDFAIALVVFGSIAGAPVLGDQVRKAIEAYRGIGS